MAKNRPSEPRRRTYRQRIGDWLSNWLAGATGIDGGREGPYSEQFTGDEAGLLQFEWVYGFESSNVERFAYDHRNKRLWIKFLEVNPKTGRPKRARFYWYYYEDCPYEVFQEFRDAPSKGKYVYWVLRNSGQDDIYKYAGSREGIQ